MQEVCEVYRRKTSRITSSRKSVREPFLLCCAHIRVRRLFPNDCPALAHYHIRCCVGLVHTHHSCMGKGLEVCPTWTVSMQQRHSVTTVLYRISRLSVCQKKGKLTRTHQKLRGTHQILTSTSLLPTIPRFRVNKKRFPAYPTTDIPPKTFFPEKRALY